MLGFGYSKNKYESGSEEKEKMIIKIYIKPI